MRRTILVTFLTVIAPFVAAGSGATSTGCGRCAAACSNNVGAEGKLTIPSGPAELEVTVCLNDDCESATASAALNGPGTCDGFTICDVSTSNGETTLKVLREVSEGPAPGDMVHVTVKVSGSNDALVDKEAELASVTDSSICGMDCTGASISF
ncbi:MAG: hypothetical protein IPK82_21670 [Polyangiaceae bacterium]|nr:hypothetical protein [Polyangiaceae bacterium]